MKRKIKILQSLSSLGIGGNEIFVMNYFRCLNKEEFQMDFLIYGGHEDFYEEVTEAGSKVFRVPLCHSNQLARLLYTMKYTYCMLKKNDYDIVYCNGCSFYAILKAALPAKIAGVKVITHSHSIGTPKGTVFDNLARKGLKILLSLIADYGFACSDKAGRSKYTEKFMRSNRYRVIHNAIDTKKFRYDPNAREKIRNRLNVGDAFLIGNVGRLASVKNHQFLLMIFKCVLDMRSECKLLLVGGGELEKELKQTAETLGIASKVIFLGAVKQPEKYYSAMDVFVMPSLYEGLGMVLIEAQAAGLICFCSDRIPRETEITENINYISLEKAPRYWAEKILKCIPEGNRSKYAQSVQSAGYDLTGENAVLENYYRMCVET